MYIYNIKMNTFNVALKSNRRHTEIHSAVEIKVVYEEICYN